MNNGHPELASVDEVQGEARNKCMLGRTLGDCPLKRKTNCNSLYEAMQHVLPPYHVRLLVREQLAGDKAAQDWLRRLDDVLPEQHPNYPAHERGER